MSAHPKRSLTGLLCLVGHTLLQGMGVYGIEEKSSVGATGALGMYMLQVGNNDSHVRGQSGFKLSH